MLTQAHATEFEPYSLELSPAPSGVKILLACDDARVRTAVTTVLTRSDYEVDAVASPFEAMEQIETSDYSLVLCDFRNAPAEAGPAVLQLARAQDYRPATALLQSTAVEVAESDKDIALEPVDVPYLLTEVAELLATRAFDRSQRAVGR